MKVKVYDENEKEVAVVNAKEVSGRLEISDRTVNKILKSTIYGLDGLHTTTEIWNSDKDVPAFQTI